MTERDPQVETDAARVLGYTIDQVKRKTIAELKKELKEAGTTTGRQAKREKNVKTVTFNNHGPLPTLNPTAHLLGQSSRSHRGDDDDNFNTSRHDEHRERDQESERYQESKRENDRESKSKRKTDRESKKEKDWDSDRESKGERDQDRNQDSDRRKGYRDNEQGRETRRSGRSDIDNVVELHHLLLAKTKFTVQLERDPDFSRADMAEWEKSIERTRQRLDQAINHNDANGGGSDELRKLWKRREAKIAEMQEMGLLDDELLKVWHSKQNLLKQIYRQRADPAGL
jgi:hypothetical protein